MEQDRGEIFYPLTYSQVATMALLDPEARKFIRPLEKVAGTQLPDLSPTAFLGTLVESWIRSNQDQKQYSDADIQSQVAA